MGNHSSRRASPDTNSHNRRVHDQVVTSETGGFHVFEVHIPTVHLGLAWLFFFVILAAAGYAIFRYYKRSQSREQHHESGRQSHKTDGDDFDHAGWAERNLAIGRLAELPLPPVQVTREHEIRLPAPKPIRVYYQSATSAQFRPVPDPDPEYTPERFTPVFEAVQGAGKLRTPIP